MGMFRQKLEELVASKDSLSDEDVSARVDELKGMTNDLPDEDDKSKLDRFLEDFRSVKEQDEQTAKEAAGMVSDLFEKLDTQAMKDVPDVEETSEETLADGDDTVGEYVKENVKEDVDYLNGKDADGEEIAEESVEETVATEGDDAENAEYTLEEIYQFIKKRMAEDSASCDSGEEVEEEESEDEDEVVTDHAPHIAVTMASRAAKGGLTDMVNSIIKGGR